MFAFQELWSSKDKCSLYWDCGVKRKKCSLYRDCGFSRTVELKGKIFALPGL
jgi:hypothetical protein